MNGPLPDTITPSLMTIFLAISKILTVTVYFHLTQNNFLLICSIKKFKNDLKKGLQGGELVKKGAYTL